MSEALGFGYITSLSGGESVTDFHAHVIPGIDDGSKSVEMSLSMMREEQEQGVKAVVATPHFYAHQTSVRQFLHRRTEALASLKQAMESEAAPFPEIYAGAEVYYFREMGRAEQLPELCIGQTRTILIEMPFAQWDDQVLGNIRAIIEKQKLTVVLAHVERYIGFQKNKTIWNRVMELPLYPQINAGSFCRKKHTVFAREKTRKFAMEHLRKHPDLILGSDCHNLTSRRPNLAAGRAEIESAFGKEALERIDEVTSRVLSA